MTDTAPRTTWTPFVPGAVLIATAGSLFLGLLLTRPDAGLALGAAMILELVMGREATIPVAMMGGAPPWIVAITSITQNLGLAALLLPLLEGLGARVRSGSHDVWRHLRTSQHDPERGRRFVGRYGPWGLLFFMLIPFGANGAVIAAVVARLAGLSGPRLWIPLTAGVVITATAWTFAYDALFRISARIDPRAPLLLMLLFAVVAIGPYFVVRRPSSGGPDPLPDEKGTDEGPRS